MRRRRKAPAGAGTDGTQDDARAEHRRALDDLQRAIDDTMREGDAEAQREALRRARDREAEAHASAQRRRQGREDR